MSLLQLISSWIADQADAADSAADLSAWLAEMVDQQVWQAQRLETAPTDLPCPQIASFSSKLRWSWCFL